jgi:N-ethylmaleimide reductase
MTTTATQELFTPIQVGPLSLTHRVVMAPLTRARSQQPGDIPSDLMVEYYGQRASNGGLIISEATTISISGRGWFGAPGMYSDEQVAGWRRVLSAVQAKGGHMFSQLWHTGRASHLESLALNPYDRNTFYTFDAHGYTDYPLYSEHSPPMSANGEAVV